MLKGSPTSSTIRTPSSYPASCKLYLHGNAFLARSTGRCLRMRFPTRVMQALAKKGRFQHLMGRILVHVVTARAALVGAASFGLESYRRISGVAA